MRSPSESARVAYLMLPLAMALGIAACRPPSESAPPEAAASPGKSTEPGPTIAPPPSPEKVEATPEQVAKAEEALQHAADRARRMRAALNFEDFKATVFREPFEGGKFIVNGDTPIANEKQLHEFYEQNVKPHQNTRLIVDQISGMDNKWNAQQRKRLTYCVSSGFGARQGGVVAEMENATGAWEQVAAVDFIHDASQDASCGPGNTAVVFDVSPVNVNEEYLARAFFPNEPRVNRNVLIDESSFALDPAGKLKLVGILRHELGHTLGFRHEHTRPESGACFEDNDWRELTSYDDFSVMHYPQCNGRGDWSLTLTLRDKNGVACLYGPTSPFTIDPAVVDVEDCAVVEPAPVAAGQPLTQSFAAQSVAKDAQNEYGPFAVAAGSPLEVKIDGATASGDPDLYVRFDVKPGVHAYDCRPYVDGPSEACALMVPAGSSQAFVMVRGYASGTYDLQVTRSPPAVAALASGGAGPAR